MIRLMLFLLLSLSSTANEGWIPHLVGASRSFQSDLILANHSGNEASITFFDKGQIVRQIDVAAGNQIVVPSYEIGDLSGSLYFETSTSLLDVSVRYQGQLYANQVTVPLPAPVGTVFRYFVDQDHNAWVGIALLNVGATSAVVSASAIDSEGKVIRQISISESMATGSKVTLTLAPEFLQDAQQVEIQSTGRLAPTVLGGINDETQSRLTSFAPASVWSDRLLVQISGGFAPITETVIVSNGMIEFQGVSAALPTDNDPIADWMNASFINFRVTGIKDPCCDMRFYSAELIEAGKGNAVFYSDFDLNDKSPDADATQTLIQQLFYVAQELTGRTSTVFPLDP